MLINYYLKKYNFTKKVLEFIVGAVLGDYNLVGGVTVKRNPFENASNSEKFQTDHGGPGTELSKQDHQTAEVPWTNRGEWNQAEVKPNGVVQWGHHRLDPLNSAQRTQERQNTF